MQSAFHLHVSETGKLDDKLDDRTSITPASEQGCYDLSLLKRFLGSFGALRLFAPAQETSGVENVSPSIPASLLSNKFDILLVGLFAFHSRLL